LKNAWTTSRQVNFFWVANFNLKFGFDIEKSIVSGVSTPDTMLFIVGRFTFFLLKLSCYPGSFSLLRLDDFNVFR
ncbi:hypothetical protein, partial [Streptococcus pneumoniae]|uniref:hypothetical protein n=1 Tax=Streptococcus pneumoniae TaxID=1313 RepID=UPI001D0C87BC